MEQDHEFGVPLPLVAARKAIANAGGPRALSRRLSDYLGVYIDVKRVEQWRYRGIPDEWTTIIEHVCGVKREKLNPHLYDVQVAHKVMHRKLTRYKLTQSTA